MSTHKTSFNVSAGALWASAFVLAGMTILQAGRLASNPAFAEMAVQHNDYTLMTTDSGRGGDENPWELLFVIDARDQVLMVYEIEDARRQQMFLRGGGPLPALFARARGG